MRIEEQQYLDFSEVLLKPKRSTLKSRKDVILEREFKMPNSNRTLNGIPIIASNMSTVATIAASEVLTKNNMFTALHKFIPHEELSKVLPNDNVFYSMGITSEDYQKFKEFCNKNGFVPNICIDVANGYSETFLKFCSDIRNKFEEQPIIMAGNVCTPEIVEELILNGVDICKVGIGSGAGCMTRAVAGVGVPQFSSVVNCADAAHGLGGLVCSDGGITCPGDMVKAFGAGADFVMIGSEFAGHDESDGEYIFNDDGTIIGVATFGMSSSVAMNKHYGKVDSYRSSEGRSYYVPYRGPLQDTVNYYLGGLRSGMTYIGAKSIKEVSKRATFIKVRNTLNEKYKDSTNEVR